MYGSLDGSFREPEFEFSGGRFGIARTVDEVVVDGQCKIASYGARGGFDWVGCTHHGSDCLGCVGSADRHGDDRAADKVVAHVLEERSLAVFGVVSFNGCALCVDELQAGDFEASSLDSTGDFSDQISAYSAWLNEYKCRLHFPLKGTR